MSQGPTPLQSTRQRVRRWWPWVLLSTILHLPLTPIGPLIGLLSLLLRLHAPVPNEPVEELLGIPVELLAAPSPPVDNAAAAEADGNAVVIAPPKPKVERKPKHDPTDAGVPDASIDAGTDASVVDAGLVADAGPPDAGLPPVAGDAGIASSDGGTESVDAGAPRPDPFAIAGDLGKFQKGNVNVRIHLFMEALKRHPAGSVIVGFLGRDPQWREFLGPSGLDLLTDVSKIVIMGPQLIDSSQVGVFVEGNPAAVRKALDAIVQHSEGAHWETRNKKPVANVQVAGAERVFVFFPNRGAVIVPPKPAEQMIALTKFPALAIATGDDEILQLMLKTPHRVRAFKRAGIEVPPSISLARVFIAGTQNGGAHVRLELEDASPEAAATHAPDLERDLAKASMGFFSLRLRTEAAQILGEATLSPLIVGGILREVQKQFVPKPTGP